MRARLYFIGNNIGVTGRGLVPPDKAAYSGYETIIGNGAGLFSNVIAHFDTITYTNGSPRHLDLNPTEVAGLLYFEAGVPATKLYQGKDFMQVETAAENLTPYSEDMTNQWPTSNASWGDQDFLGGVMTKLVENNDNGKEHNGSTGNVHSLTSGNTYIVSIYVKADERTEIRMAWGSRFPAGTWCEFDVANGTKGSSGAGVSSDNYGIYLVKEGIYRCWFIATCNSTGTAGWGVSLLNAIGSLTYNGDGVSGLYLWGGQAEDGTPVNASSYITTTGSALIRAKDQAYWASAVVPDALRGEFELDWIPYPDELTEDYHYLYDFEASGASDRIVIFYNKGSNNFRVAITNPSTVLVESGAVTFDPREKITIRVYPSSGLLIVAGCTSGNGIFVGKPWETTEGNVWLGQTGFATQQCAGLISEPHVPRYIRDPYPLADFDDADFTNASDRQLFYPQQVCPTIESFAGGVLAEITLGANRFAQIETAKENIFTYCQQLQRNDWSKTAVDVTANAATAPDGELTADKISELATTDYHYISQSHTPDGASYYTLSVFAQADEISDFVLSFNGAGGFPANAWGYFDLSDGSTAVGAGATNIQIEPCGSGSWYRCSISSQSNAASLSSYYILLRDGISYPGTLGEGMNFWNAQLELGLWSSSPILTTNLPVTRAKDELYWPSASVPALLRGRFKVDWIPVADQSSTANRYFFTSAASGPSDLIGAWYNHSTDVIRVRNFTTATDLVESAALTFSPYQKVTITVDPATGTLTVEGASSGNGTVVGTPWVTTAGNWTWGSNTAFSAQCNGLISEPYL